MVIKLNLNYKSTDSSAQSEVEGDVQTHIPAAVRELSLMRNAATLDLVILLAIHYPKPAGIMKACEAVAKG